MSWKKLLPFNIGGRGSVRAKEPDLSRRKFIKTAPIVATAVVTGASTLFQSCGSRTEEMLIDKTYSLCADGVVSLPADTQFINHVANASIRHIYIQPIGDWGIVSQARIERTVNNLVRIFGFGQKIRAKPRSGFNNLNNATQAQILQLRQLGFHVNGK